LKENIASILRAKVKVVGTGLFIWLGEEQGQGDRLTRAKGRGGGEEMA
jgi:hypothetical protein